MWRPLKGPHGCHIYYVKKKKLLFIPSLGTDLKVNRVYIIYLYKKIIIPNMNVTLFILNCTFLARNKTIYKVFLIFFYKISVVN